MRNFAKQEQTLRGHVAHLKRCKDMLLVFLRQQQAQTNHSPHDSTFRMARAAAWEGTLSWQSDISVRACLSHCRGPNIALLLPELCDVVVQLCPA